MPAVNRAAAVFQPAPTDTSRKLAACGTNRLAGRAVRPGSVKSGTVQLNSGLEHQHQLEKRMPQTKRASGSALDLGSIRKRRS